MNMFVTARSRDSRAIQARGSQEWEGSRGCRRNSWPFEACEQCDWWEKAGARGAPEHPVLFLIIWRGQTFTSDRWRSFIIFLSESVIGRAKQGATRVNSFEFTRV